MSDQFLRFWLAALCTVVLCFPRPGKTAQVDDYLNALQNDRKVGQLITCYNEGIWRSVGAVASESADDIAYRTNLIILGGFPAIATEVQKECDIWYNSLGIQGAQDEVAAVRKIFVEYIRLEHRRFLSQCENLTDRSRFLSQHVIALQKMCVSVRAIDIRRSTKN